MRVAIVHDSLLEFGGAERVIKEILNCFSDVTIFTAFSSKRAINQIFENNPPPIRTSWANKLYLSKHVSLSQILSPLIWSSFDLSDFDLIITSSAYLLSSILGHQQQPVIHYVHSLPKNIFGVESPTKLQSLIPYHQLLRPLYVQSLQRGSVITNSHHMKQVVHDNTGVISEVIYPPVRVPSSLSKKLTKKYFVTVTRIDNTKSLEIAIKAFNELGKPLKIIGKSLNHSYKKKLERLAKPNVEFLGFQSDNKINNIVANAQAFIFTAKNEDFGIAPVEAMAMGTPVIAYAGGGLKETVVPFKTGLLFHEHTPKALSKAVRQFSQSIFSSKEIYSHAQQFSSKTFTKKIKKYINQITKSR